MRRRQFILLFCRAAITLPRVALAQKPDRVRRIGVLMGLSESDPESRGFVATFWRNWRDWVGLLNCFDAVRPTLTESCAGQVRRISPFNNPISLI